VHRGADAIAALRGVWRDGELHSYGEFHAIWVLALSGGPSAVADLMALAESHEDPRVIVQAVRAIADLSDPVLVSGRLDAEPGDRELGLRLTQLAVRQSDPRVDREVVIALGRLRSAATVDCLREVVDPVHADAALTHAAVHTLRRSANWTAVLQWLDAGAEATPTQRRLREWALLALAEQPHAGIADGLIDRLESDPVPEHRIEYVDLLSRIARLPGPWTYWGFRPGPRPANAADWERTDAIQTALNAELRDPDHGVRAFTVQRLLREKLPLSVDALAAWLNEESNPEHVGVILSAAQTLPHPEAAPLLETTLRNRSHAADNRLHALELLTAGLDAGTEQRLVPIAEAVEDGPVLAALLTEIGRRPALAADALLTAKLASTEATVRAASLRALTARHADAARGHFGALLNDSNVDVLRAAVAACAAFSQREHADRILELAELEDRELQRECLAALLGLDDSRARPHAIAGLEDAVTQLASLEYLERFGDSSQLEAVERVARPSSDAELQAAALRAIAAWAERAEPDDREELYDAASRIHGTSGAVRLWFVSGPLTAAAADAALSAALKQSPAGSAADVVSSATPGIAADADARIELGAPPTSEPAAWLAAADVSVDEEMDVELLASSAGTLQIWLNGESVFQRDAVAEFRPNADTVAARLNAGRNRLAVRIDQVASPSAFHLGFRRRSSKAEHEELMQFVLSNRGDLNRGRDVFAAREKSLCAKCHRLEPDGPRIGPDLTGIGRRFSRVSILESILEPSRTIAPSYATVAVLLTDGRLISGISVAKDDATMTIGDNQGQLHQVPIADIDAISEQQISTMPLGIEQRLSRQELLDLIEFLSQQTD
jgi:putative heme-binding domain-containing protein